MLNPTIPAAAMLMLLAAPGAATAPALPAATAVSPDLGQHITIHVPRMTVTTTTIIATTTTTARSTPAFREKKADNCLKMKKIIGFWVMTNDSIDLLLDDGTRLRAQLGSDCPSLGFYAGFYVKPTQDGKICAKRDVLRSRSGKACAVGGFSKLVPVK
ncbi:hypothetical protein [Sphingomonas sp.]|uniref:hypothetical protein n=1 Tax=Sphingomonas sp. TaxID=28214 RepID=UPI001B2155A7|nr:hypothetical protein [Sphingomonas sp.]MBO9714659.1 hypothetical protein [Sphingomonas sp.]